MLYKPTMGVLSVEGLLWLGIGCQTYQIFGFIEILAICAAFFKPKKTSYLEYADYNLVEENLIDKKYYVTVNFGALVVSNKALKL